MSETKCWGIFYIVAVHNSESRSEHYMKFLRSKQQDEAEQEKKKN